VQPGQAAQPSPLAQTFTAWFRGPGLTSTALSLAIVLGSAAISAILTLVAMSTMDSTKMFPTTFSTLPLLMGWSLGGQFVMSGSNSYETVTLTFTLLPMGALTAAGIGVFWLARRRAAVDGSAAPLVPTLARAGAEALAVALVACLVTAPFSMTATMMGLKVMTVSSSALMTILLVTVVVFVALVVARSGGSLLERLPSPVVQVSRELGALSTALGVVLGIFIIVAYIAAVLIQGSGFASILLLPVLLPNLVLLALGMGSLGGITLDKSEAAAALAYFLPSLGGKDGGDAYAWTWFGSWSILLFAAMIVAIVAAALRVGVRRSRTGRTEWQRVWQLPLVSLALGAIVFYGLLPLRFSGADTPMRSSGGGSGHYMSVSLQPNALTFLLVGIVAAIISVLAEMLPLWAYSSFPAVLQLAGGKKASAAWRAGTSGVAPTSSAQQWAYSTDPATGASIATDPATGAVFSMDPATGQWVETTPASQAPAPGFGGAAAGAPASGQLPEPAPMSAASRKKVILGLSAFGVVVDTLFVCTATALAILVAGADVLHPGVSAKESAGTLTQDAIAHLVGEWSRWPMALLVVVLAYTTIIGAFSYAQVCLDYLTDRPGVSRALQIGAVVCAGVGSVQQLTTVWTLADVLLGLGAIINLVALVLLSRWVVGALRDWEARRGMSTAEGDQSVFRGDSEYLPAPLPEGAWERADDR